MIDTELRQGLIVGASGFIGSLLCKELNRNLKARLIKISRKDYDDESFIKCDVRDSEEVKKILTGMHFDFIVYLVADTTISSLTGKIKHIELSVNGLINIVESLDFRMPTKLIFMSSAEIYGKFSAGATECSPLSPRSFYGLSKFLGEKTVSFYEKSIPNLSTVILRPSLVFGNGGKDRFFVNQAIRTLKIGEEFNMTLGEQTRDFIHVNDVVSGILQCLKFNDISHGVFNVSSGRGIRLKDVILYVSKKLNSSSKINFGALEYRDNEIMNYEINSKKLQSKTEWIPSISLYDWISAEVENSGE